ncbi:MAG: CinA family protein, partial [Planctomycetes bacterium]|nr:CinA family protein [Planctomycetota bacterium]
ARGVAHTTGADLALSTTGIAGPTGGTAEKPVGLVFVGVSLFDKVWSHRLQLRGDRWRIKGRATRHALNFARLALLQEGQPVKK